MGKKTKKQNHRARPLPQNVAAVGPQSLSRPDPSVVCPHCLELFTLSTAALSGWRTVCPHCEMIIVPGDYDERRAEISKDASVASKAASPILSCRNRIAAKHFKTRFSLLKRRHAWRIRRINENNWEVLEAWDKARHELAAAERFAHSRYYTSSWFQLTGKPLERGEVGPLAPYRLISQYAKKDRYQLKASKKNNRVGRGLQAEWFVYSTLDERAHAEGLLQGARVCPNLYIGNGSADELQQGSSGSWSGSRFGYLRTRGALKPLFSQIDCAVITEYAVYIIEVKSCYAHVAVDANGNVLSYAGTEDSVDRNKNPWNCNGDVRQCARHASAFATRYPQIPFERIFEIVVYVDPFSMANERPWMVDNACVAALGCKGESFIEVIEDTERSLQGLSPLFSKGELDRFSDCLIRESGDPNGRKEFLHLERLQKLTPMRECC